MIPSWQDEVERGAEQRRAATQSEKNRIEAEMFRQERESFDKWASVRIMPSDYESAWQGWWARALSGRKANG